MFSSPSYYLKSDFDERRKIIRKTYNNALENGENMCGL